MKSKRLIVIGTLLLALIITILVSISIGPITIPFKKTIQILLNKWQISVDSTYTQQEWAVITEIRLPRVLVAAFVGAALAVSGAAMQGLFRNPLVEPGFIGVSSGAALGAVCAIFFGWTYISPWFLSLSAFIGALFALSMILLIWRISRSNQMTMLLLLGIGVNAFFAALMNVLTAVSKDEQELRSIVYWLQGGLEARTWEHVVLVLFPVIFGGLILSFFGRELNVMLLGEEHAVTTGINVKGIRYLILICTALVTGAAVAVSGMIGFVGLVVPHMLRLIIGPDHRLLLPASFIGGAIFLILADLISRMLIQPITLQVGVISAIIGAPLFVVIILRTGRGGAVG